MMRVWVLVTSSSAISGYILHLIDFSAQKIHLHDLISPRKLERETQIKRIKNSRDEILPSTAAAALAARAAPAVASATRHLQIKKKADGAPCFFFLTGMHRSGFRRGPPNL
jgi:hypothetical protein